MYLNWSNIEFIFILSPSSLSVLPLFSILSGKYWNCFERKQDSERYDTNMWKETSERRVRCMENWMDSKFYTKGNEKEYQMKYFGCPQHLLKQKLFLWVSFFLKINFNLCLVSYLWLQAVFFLWSFYPVGLPLKCGLRQDMTK